MICISLGCEKHPIYSPKSVLETLNNNSLKIVVHLKLAFKSPDPIGLIHHSRYSETTFCLSLPFYVLTASLLDPICHLTFTCLINSSMVQVILITTLNTNLFSSLIKCSRVIYKKNYVASL